MQVQKIAAFSDGDGRVFQALVYNRFDDLVNQTLEVLESEDGAVELEIYDIPASSCLP